MTNWAKAGLFPDRLRYSVGRAFGVQVTATIIYGALLGRVGPVGPMELFRQSWLSYPIIFAVF